MTAPRRAASAGGHATEPCDSPQPGASGARCSCGLSISTPLRSLAAGWIRAHPRAAAGAQHPQTGIHKLHTDDHGYCELPRCRRPHTFAALCAGTCGATWAAPIKAIVEEAKRTHR